MKSAQPARAAEASGGAHLRALVIEDEPPSRARLVAALLELPEIASVAGAADAEAARVLLAGASFDLLFVDIELPGESGLALVAELAVPTRPLVVFVTAHEEHALDAFDVEALAYLTKPWSRERLARVVTRASGLSSTGRSALLALRCGARATLVDPRDVLVATAASNYVKVRTPAALHLTREPLAALLRRLPARDFLRVHRSTIVRIDAMRSIEADSGGITRVRLVDGSQHVVGRAWLAGVRRALSGR